ncbi:MAG: hydroxylamine oxidoreductase [Fibrobacteria bacterium]|nr:hydroxylamine oxidoreductase [Fibrobacteria bacterium]
MQKIIFSALITVLLVGMSWGKRTIPDDFSKETKECLECHKDDNVGLYQQWGDSKHYSANVGCYECHMAKKGDKDILKDEDHKAFSIATIVSPKDCGRCHEKEVDEFINSHHSKAGRIMGSLDNLLAEVVEGNNDFKTKAHPEGVSAAAVNGCWQCHGSQIEVDEKTGKLDPATWPNSGIGRINPDGSEGSCSACHSRHSFSVELARQPENCGKCHLGPDHPQLEIYNESKHGIAYNANKDKMNLASSKWVVGEDYSAAPTCATCHMSATPDLPVTHNVGLRIKWNNRPVHSKLSHKTDEKWGLESAKFSSNKRRKDMEKVCIACHQKTFTDNFFTQYEGLLSLYDEKYAKPGEELYKLAQAVLKTTSSYAPFSEAVDYTWFELWHHEGRRARHAASMQAPDYTHWHGTYDLAKHWNSKYIPELREIIHRFKDDEKATKQVKALEKGLDKVLNSPNHKWSINKEDPKTKAIREKNQKAFKARYK